MKQSEMIAEMSAALLAGYLKMKEIAKERGIRFILTDVLRAKKEQLALAAQGRTLEELVALLLKYNWTQSAAKVRIMAQKMDMRQICDALRKEAGMRPLPAGDWYKVTWTMNSYHYANKEGKGDAMDVALDIPGHEWDIKIDENQAAGPDFDELGKIGEEAGLVWLGKIGDRPHFQVKQEDRGRA